MPIGPRRGCAAAALSLTVIVIANGCSAGNTGHSTRAAPTTSVAPALAGHIRAENARPGDSSWVIPPAGLAKDGEIQGYADQTSVLPGSPVSISVSVQAASAPVAVDVYRMGWYGGAGARHYRSVRVTAHDQGVWSPTTHLASGVTFTDPASGLIDLRWPPATTFVVPTDWPSGYYLAKLTDLSVQKSTYVPFVVRAARPSSPLLVQASVTTWEAYNEWGGASLYKRYGGDGKLVTPPGPPGPRATSVSFNRPYDQSQGTGEFLLYEYPFVRWLERGGIDADYSTDVDTDEHADVLRAYKGFVSLGHDEYWSLAMRDGVERARDAGVNLAFLGANESYWKIRLDADGVGNRDRIMTCYRNTGEDPVYQVSQRGADATIRWRDPPLNRPEAAMAGEMYDHQGTGTATVAATQPDWLFAGTGLTPGQQLGQIVGPEYDRVFDDVRPPTLTVLFEGSPGVLASVDSAPGAKGTYNATLYTAPSSAIVFDAGTIRWSWVLDGYGHNAPDFGVAKPEVATALQRLTANLLNRLSS